MSKQLIVIAEGPYTNNSVISQIEAGDFYGLNGDSDAWVDVFGDAQEAGDDVHLLAITAYDAEMNSLDIVEVPASYENSIESYFADRD